MAQAQTAVAVKPASKVVANAVNKAVTKATTKATKETLKVSAIKIFNRVMASKNPSRAKVIAQLVEKIGLTPGGASTYYANMKNGVEKKPGGWDVSVSAVKAKPALKAVKTAAAKPAKPAAVKKAA